MGIIIKTYQIYIALLIIGITAFIVMSPDAQDINYELIQMIIGICVAFIAGIWAFFSYLANVKADKYAKVSSQNHKLLESQAEKINNLSEMIYKMRAPTEIDNEQNEKIEYHDKELLEHYKLIQQNSKDIEIIRNEVKGMRGEVTEFKKFIEERFSDLKEFIRKTK